VNQILALLMLFFFMSCGQDRPPKPSSVSMQATSAKYGVLVIKTKTTGCSRSVTIIVTTGNKDSDTKRLSMSNGEENKFPIVEGKHYLAYLEDIFCPGGIYTDTGSAITREFDIVGGLETKIEI